MQFNQQQRALLSDLKRNPTFQSILDEIEGKFRDLPRYKPSKDNDFKDPVIQAADWEYWSGFDKAKQDLLKLLRD